MAASCYITFPTIYNAIRAEKLLEKQAYPFKMVPVPRSISSSCGTALRCDCRDLASVRNILVQNELELEGFYKLDETGLKKPRIEELFFDE